MAALAAVALAATACGLSPKASSDLSTALRTSGGNGGLSGSGTGTGGAAGASSLGPGGNPGAASGGATPGASSATGPGAVVGSGGGGGATAGQPGGQAGGSSSNAGGSGTGGVGGGGAAGSSPGNANTGTSPGANPGGSGPQAAYETTGIRNGVIYIGIHAPETGAAPVPLQAFVTGTKLFWENHTVFGHQVVMQFMDDQYNPSVARQVCETLSRQDFLVIGGAGTDQIQACATDPVLSSSHTPYLSAGVTTNGLIGLPDYFAFSQTYAAQSQGVFSMASHLYPGDAKQKWAIVTENTPNFNDTTQAMAKVLSAEGVPYCIIRTNKYYSDSDVSNNVGQASSCGAKVVYLDVDPNFWIAMVRDASSSLFFPDWVGPGVTNGEDLVAPAVCGEQPNIKAAFLSPYMGLDRQPPDFSNENNPAPDAPAAERDIELLVYGTSQVIYNAMLATGSFAALTRDNLISTLARFSATYGKQLTVLPTVNMPAGGGHFGGTAMWELQLSCSATQYTTVGMTSG